MILTYRRSMVETMNMFQLNDYIKEERMKGSKNLVFHIIEQQKRFAYPFATLILTIVAVAMASRKVRGGIGLHLGLGLLLALLIYFLCKFLQHLQLMVTCLLSLPYGFPICCLLV